MPTALAEPPLAAPRLDFVPDDAADEEIPKGFEFVDGVLKEKPMGWESSRYAWLIGYRFGEYLAGKPIAVALGAQGLYKCFPHKPSQTRLPDVSLVLHSRMPAKAPKGACEIAPDLVVEVVSDNDKADDIDERLEDFRRAETTIRWAVFPNRRTVYAHTEAGIRRFGPEDVIDAEPVLPGFRVPVAKLFDL